MTRLTQTPDRIRRMIMEGGLKKPTRFDIDWKNKDYLDEDLFEKELRRVADACHGCRRCVSLCNSFPTLFDLIDESKHLK